eukprot:scaffold1477_cov94-Cylindrotheca_fusiformis.AAC.1
MQLPENLGEVLCRLKLIDDEGVFQLLCSERIAAHNGRDKGRAEPITTPCINAISQHRDGPLKLTYSQCDQGAGRVETLLMLEICFGYRESLDMASI